MTKYILITLLSIISFNVKAQTQRPMFPEDRTLSCALGISAAGISYPLFYSAFNYNGLSRKAHTKSIIATSCVSVAVSLLSYNLGPNTKVNSRQNLTACLISSAFTITLVRIGIGNNN